MSTLLNIQKRIFVVIIKIIMRYLSLLFIALLLSCNTPKKEILETHAYTNDLINETSPYLLQHAHNPVNWKAWNENTLQQAKDQNKLMIVSIGYSACHWCHVMERESFEDSTVASVMNDNFIPVKVDREERPDVDRIYINAVELMTGSAGWPLNVITLPDGRPVWGGTYFRKNDWINAIERIQELYEENPQRLEEQASRIEQGIKNSGLITVNTDDVDFTAYKTEDVLSKWKESFDKKDGGYKRTPKFMMPSNFSFLLRQAMQAKDKELLEHVKLTLDKIAYGGIYDHVGGGFSRYSTDARWHVPHFEKMLYDNAQLVSLYSNAYTVTQKPLYQEVVEETLAFINREMTHESGAFYSSLDADSETVSGELEEGAYYIYTKEELEGLLKDDFALFSEYYNVNGFGKWEKGHYVLIRDESDVEIVKNHGISQKDLDEKKTAWKKMLLDFRNQRPKPRLDDKTQTSWNGLMLKGYIDAYKVFKKQEYLNTALKNAQFIADHQMKPDGSLFHIYKDGKSSINGYLEDYAAVIDAYIALHEVTLDHQWIEKAKILTDYTITHFLDAEKGMFYFTSDEDTQLITRNFEYIDQVIPASNSMMAKNLFTLSHHYDEREFDKIATQMLKNVMKEMAIYPGGFSNWFHLLSNYQSKYYEIVVVGENAKEKIQELNSVYLPNKLIAGGTQSGNSPLLEGRFVPGQTFIYVCVNNACKLPVTETQEALKLVN